MSYIFNRHAASEEDDDVLINSNNFPVTEIANFRRQQWAPEMLAEIAECKHYKAHFLMKNFFMCCAHSE
jgi:hypothetical protein